MKPSQWAPLFCCFVVALAGAGCGSTSGNDGDATGAGGSAGAGGGASGTSGTAGAAGAGGGGAGTGGGAAGGGGATPDAGPPVTWTPEVVTTPYVEDFGGVWGTSATNVWVAGLRRVMNWDGSAWTDTELNALFTGPRQHLAGTAPDDVWVSGQRVASFDGSQWTELGAPNVGPDVATVVWRTPGLETWAADLRGFWKLDGSTWVGVGGELGPDPNRNVTWHAMWGSSDDDIWAVGIGGHRAHYDGQSWTLESENGPDYLGMWGLASDAIWVVGSFQVWRFDGTDWSEVFAGLPPQRRDIWVGSESDIWVVGQGGRVQHFDGQSWTEFGDVAGGRLLEAVWGTGDGTVWAVGNDGAIVRFKRDAL